jgi:hypothetical protein
MLVRHFCSTSYPQRHTRKMASVCTLPLSDPLAASTSATTNPTSYHVFNKMGFVSYFPVWHPTALLNVLQVPPQPTSFRSAFIGVNPRPTVLFSRLRENLTPVPD